MRNVLCAALTLLLLSSAGRAQETMYGSEDNGLFGIVNPVTGEFTTLGDPADGIGREILSGITFDATGRVFGSVPDNNDGTLLILINPVTGDRIDTIGSIEDSHQNLLRITDLATQPATDILFGVASTNNLYTINKTTAVATLVGPLTGRGGLAFAPDGRLFLATTGSRLSQIDPASGATIGSVLNLASCIDGLGIRPSDGAAFATECDGADLFRLDLASGNLDDLEDTNEDTTDIAFPLQAASSAAPALSSLGLAALVAAVAGLGIRRLR